VRARKRRWFSTYVASDCRKCGAAIGTLDDARNQTKCPVCGFDGTSVPASPQGANDANGGSDGR
jgi:hypothetical protein